MNQRIALLSAAIAVAVTSLSFVARAQSKVAADEPPTPPPDSASREVGFQVGIYGYGSELTMNNSLHAVGGSSPDPLIHANMHFVGQGWEPGAEFRFAVLPVDYFGRFRFGFGIGVGGASGFHLASDPMPAGVSYQASSFWGARFTGFMGQQFDVGDALDADGVHHHAFFSPYLDLAAIGTITQVSINLHVKGLGSVGSSTFDAYAFTLAPRAGVLIPIAPNVALDLGGFKSVYGAEHYGGYGGLTIYGP